MARRLQRFLGPVHGLDAGQYTLETASGLPAIACPECGDITELESSRCPKRDGFVRFVWQCCSQSCSFVDFIILESYDEDVAW